MININCFPKAFLLFVVAFICPVLADNGSPYQTVKTMHQNLKERRFDEIDRLIMRAQADYELDTNKEVDVADLLYSFAMADPEIEIFLNEWVLVSPSSYAARSMRGAFRIAMGAAWRGTGWAKDVHPARIQYMDRYMNSAYEDLRVAATLTSKPAFATGQMIEWAKRVGRRDIAEAALEKSRIFDPNATGPYAAYSELLLPRWGGNYQEMENLAKSLEQASHPKLVQYALKIRHKIVADRANLSWHKGDLLAALNGFLEANTLIEMANTYAQLASLYIAMGQTSNASAAVNRCLTIAPLDGYCLFERSNINFNLRKPGDAVTDLRHAAFLGWPGAARKLGMVLIDGPGVAVNIPEGIEWLERAAYFWDLDALYNLGATFERGSGVPVDLKRAANYYRACANLGDAMCANNLGLMVWYGNGVPKDNEEAIRLWHRAAKNGAWQAGHNLNFFLSPMQRIKVMVTLGPGIWDLKFLLKILAFIIGIPLVVWILLRRRLATLRSKSSTTDLKKSRFDQ